MDFVIGNSNVPVPAPIGLPPARVERARSRKTGGTMGVVVGVRRQTAEEGRRSTQIRRLLAAEIGRLHLDPGGEPS